MTRTEDRLADALAAVGRSVREETLPPLPARGPSPVPRRWGRWLVPLAAAASVILVVVLVSAVHLFPGKPGGGNVRTAGLPRYYAALDRQERSVVIRATATGAVTGRTPRPGGNDSFPSAIAATDGGREFVAAYSGTLASHQERTWLYSFRLTAAGRVTGFARIRGGVFTGVSAANGIAVSPDGSQVAVVLEPPLNPIKPPPPPAEIGVVSLRTGAQALWAGGMNRAGFEFNVASVSWMPDGRSLLYLGVWCQGELSGVPYCTTGPHVAQVRTLRLTPGGGRLDQGSVLLTDSYRYPDIIQALAGPGGKSINLVELTGPDAGKVFPQPGDLRVIGVPLDHGRPRLLYRAAVDSHPYVFLGSDASGRYLLLAWARNGWIDHGRLRPLPAPARAGLSFGEAW
jgi:hypothetical protein